MLLYSNWLALPINKRHELAQFFGIVKKGSTHVQDNVIVSDGYTIADVEHALTVENLQTYLGVGTQETDFAVLWDMLINPVPEVEEVVVKGDFDIESIQPMPIEPVLESTTKPVEVVETTEPIKATKHAGGRPKGAKNK